MDTASANKIVADTLVYFDDVTQFRHTLSAESDRACALMAAAYIDNQLGQLLCAYFIDAPTLVKPLLGAMGPLSTLSSRISLAYLLGLIGPNARHDLDLIRKIRNDFAHKSKPMTFESPGVIDRCRELKTTRYHKDYVARGHYVSAVLWITAGIHRGITTIRRCTSPAEVEVDDTLRDNLLKMTAMVLNRALTDRDPNNPVDLERLRDNVTNTMKETLGELLAERLTGSDVAEKNATK